MYYFELTISPNVIWVDMSRLALDPGSLPLVIDPHDDSLVGDVTERFVPQQMAF